MLIVELKSIERKHWGRNLLAVLIFDFPVNLTKNLPPTDTMALQTGGEDPLGVHEYFIKHFLNTGIVSH
jgi:hypothetical protein